MSDLYQILQVTKQATELEIKKAYFKLAMKWHPDKAPSDDRKKEYEEHFYKILNAYKILSDENKRKLYDDTLSQIYTELREVDRDVTYHRFEELIERNKQENATYLKMREGRVVFDLDDFNQNFIKNNLSEFDLHNNTLETFKIKQSVFNNMSENLQVARDEDTEVKLPKPMGEYTLSSFNQVFESLKKANETGMTKELVEVQELNASSTNAHGLVEYSPIDSIGLIDMKRTDELTLDGFNSKIQINFDEHKNDIIVLQPKVNDSELEAYLKSRDMDYSTSQFTFEQHANMPNLDDLVNQ